jgi:competence protein ComEA
MSRLSFLTLERNPVLKTGIFFKLFVVSLSLSVFFLTSCGNTSYFENSNGTAKSDTERISSTDTLDSDTSKVSSKKEESIFVEVRGAVMAPGVFEVEKGTRVFSLIALAGGLSNDADISGLNQAAVVSDGEKIYVPREGEEETISEASLGDAKGTKVNINTADSAALMTLPGIGEAKAKLIVDFRQKNGPFRSIEDITKISGIKSGLYEKIKDQITV